MTIYSEKCIDESKGFTITDRMTGKTYTDEQAHQLPKHIQTRLTLVPNKLGRYVMTIEEADECMKKRFSWWE